MKIKYDKETDTLSIDLAKGRYEVSKKITGNIIVDVTKKGKVLGIEILDASETIQSFNPHVLLTPGPHVPNQRQAAA